MSQKHLHSPVTGDSTRIQLAEARAVQAEERAEQAEAALQFILTKEIELLQEISTRLPNRFPSPGIVCQKGALERLTSRQREILQSITLGRNTKQIADILKISPKTVEYHRMKLMTALNLYDVPSLVRFALWSGLLPQEHWPPHAHHHAS